MNEIRLIDEGNDEDFGVAEYDFGAHPQSARAAALQAKLRAEAKARLATGATGWLTRLRQVLPRNLSDKEKINYDSSS